MPLYFSHIGKLPFLIELESLRMALKLVWVAVGQKGERKGDLCCSCFASAVSYGEATSPCRLGKARQGLCGSLNAIPLPD